MATITTSNTTTQLLVKSTGTDIYTALKLPSDQVIMDKPFFESKSVNDVMPQTYIDIQDIALTPDLSGYCTWEIKDDEENNVKLTDKSMVLNVRNSSGITILTGSSLVSYGSAPNMTYALQIYIKSNTTIPAETYSAVIQL